MDLPFTHDEIARLPAVLSAPRFATYLAEKNGDRATALELYLWNLELSSAFIAPLHICEVSVRNSIVSAIEASYGVNWPWEQSFKISLKNPPHSYSPRRNLADLGWLPTAGKIVAELKFVFWEKMLTSGHDGAIWNAHFRQAFPNANNTKTIQILRAEGHDALFRIRDLRNRIAHHEPIFRRNIQEEYDRIRDVISWTDLIAAAWIDKIENVTAMIPTRP